MVAGGWGFGEEECRVEIGFFVGVVLKEWFWMGWYWRGWDGGFERVFWRVVLEGWYFEVVLKIICGAEMKRCEMVIFGFGAEFVV